MPMSCEDYRYQQQLLALKKRLAEDKLEPEEREPVRVECETSLFNWAQWTSPV